MHVIPVHELFGKLKNFVFQKAIQQDIRFSEKHWRYSSFAGDLLDRERFERRIRYCIIKLREFSIPETEYFEYISQALLITLEHIRKNSPASSQQRTELSIQKLLIEEIAKCFEIWYYPPDVLYYEIATEHQLATFDHTDHKWRLTGVGRYILQLSPFDVIIFLCALEVIFSHRRINSRYLSEETLEKLSKSENSLRNQLRRFPSSLRLYGIIDPSSDEPTITDFGRRIISKVSANLNVLKDTIMLLTESEVGGFSFSANMDVINEIKERVKTSSILIKDQKDSIELAVNLFVTGKYLDSLKVFYPNVEGLLNLALMKAGLPVENIIGMKAKIERLEKENVLSSKLSTWAEVVTSRNKILHGNILNDDAEIVKPLFFFICAFWNKLVDEIDLYFQAVK